MYNSMPTVQAPKESPPQGSDLLATALAPHDGRDASFQRPSLLETFGWSQNSDSNTIALLKMVRNRRPAALYGSKLRHILVAGGRNIRRPK